MAQRNLFPGSQMPTTDHDQMWNHPPPDPHLSLGNGSYMLSMDNNVESTAVLRPNGYPSTNFSNYATTNSGPSHDPFFHHPSAASSSHFSPDPYQCMPPPGSSMMHPQTDIGRSAFKRKSPVIPLAYHGVNANGCYSVGNSSNPLQPKPMVMHQYGPLDPAGITHGSGNLSNHGEDAQRNVRSRLINPYVNYSSSSTAHHFHTEGHLIHIPTMPMAPQGDPRFNFEGNQSAVGQSIINNSIINNGAFHPSSSTHSRNTSSLPTIHDSLIRGIGTNNNGYSTRSNPYWASSSQAPVGFTTTSVESSGPPGMEFVASSRHSRSLSITGSSSYRNGRARGSNSRFHGGYVENGTRSSRWSSEGVVMMDRSTFYDSRNWFDQHRDMRLDVDNMSYEELLALGERIGNVNTGLSDEAISGCLEETTYRSSNNTEDQEEEKCVICLEEYKDQDKLAKLSCHHDFHVCCIKNWLEIKNACPICKAAAFSDTKEKQS